MNSYSQNLEDQAIQNYFGIFKGTLLDVGANDGKTFSNSLALIEKGWDAYMFEPSEAAFEKLKKQYEFNVNVHCIPLAVSTKSELAEFFEMGNHLGKGDVSLLSTLNRKETERWKGTNFNHTLVNTISYSEFIRQWQPPIFDFITIDAEGMDIEILRQIDLTEVKCLCIEWNGIESDLQTIRGLVPVEMKEIYRSLENVIYARL